MNLDLPKNVSIRYVVAFSGGADSALLAYLLKEQGYNFRLIHISHGESKASMDPEAIKLLCRQCAEQLHVDLQIIDIPFNDELAKSVGTEASERQERYNALFNALLRDEVLLTGHHLDDSIETFLFRLARGTSVKGLSGIAKVSENSRLIRPLINLPKKKILQLVESAAILYGHDSTNDNTEMSRSFIRNKIIPKFVEHFTESKFYASMSRVMKNMRECSELVEELANMDIQSCLIDETGINRVIFSNMSEPRQRNMLYHFISKRTGKFLTSNGIEELRKRIIGTKKYDEFNIADIIFKVTPNTVYCTIT
jgi:tRNA(Ile)-lysidine synthase